MPETMKSTMMVKGMKESQVASIQGMNMAAAFPRRSSESVVGVASKGSRLRFSFSPTKE